MLKLVKVIVLFWLFSKCSNLNAPIMQTADQIKIENLVGRRQGGGLPELLLAASDEGFSTPAALPKGRGGES